jgi:hypothetical protein
VYGVLNPVVDLKKRGTERGIGCIGGDVKGAVEIGEL